MSVQIYETTSVRSKAESLGFYAIPDLTVLPDDFFLLGMEVEPVYPPSASDLIKLWRKATLPTRRIDNSKQAMRERVQKSADLLLPTVFISFQILTENQYATMIALNILSSYIYDNLPLAGRGQHIAVSIVTETNPCGEKCVRIDYSGPAQEMPEVIHEVIRSQVLDEQ